MTCRRIAPVAAMVSIGFCNPQEWNLTLGFLPYRDPPSILPVPCQNLSFGLHTYYELMWVTGFSLERVSMESLAGKENEK
jgi:hypothetical protein